jgi:hypothetical protein
MAVMENQGVKPPQSPGRRRGSIDAVIDMTDARAARLGGEPSNLTRSDQLGPTAVSVPRNVVDADDLSCASAIKPGFGRGSKVGHRTDLDDMTVGQLRNAFDDYQVLVFRNITFQPTPSSTRAGSSSESSSADRAAPERTLTSAARISNKDEDGTPHGACPSMPMACGANGRRRCSPVRKNVEQPSVPTLL